MNDCLITLKSFVPLFVPVCLFLFVCSCLFVPSNFVLSKENKEYKHSYISEKIVHPLDRKTEAKPQSSLQTSNLAYKQTTLSFTLRSEHVQHP